MSVITKAEKSINLTENVYQREKWIKKLEKTAKAELSAENYIRFARSSTMGKKQCLLVGSRTDYG